MGLQHKFLFMMNLLQSADVMPTQQTQAGVEELQKTLEGMKERWSKLLR